MTNTVAKITSEIVNITKNPETIAFVGKIVTRKNTKKGVVYAIGSTGYILSAAEYKLFAEAGAIAQSSLLPKKKASSKTTKATDKTKVAKAQHSKKAKTASSMSASVKEDNKVDVGYEVSLVSEEHKAILETSEFLMNYPTPSFELDTPKHIALVDKKDNLKDKATGFFDKIGKKTRDKVINAIKQD